MKFSTLIRKGSLWMAAAVIAVAASGCGGGGGGGGGDSGGGSVGGGGTGGGSTGGGTTQTTTISGKVTLSSTLASAKPAVSFKGVQYDPRQRAYISVQQPVDNRYSIAATTSTGLSNAFVYLYDSDEPEWLYPIASAQTDSDGNYTMDSLINSTENEAEYTDGDPIPAGRYTLKSIKFPFDPSTGRLTGDSVLVAVQTIVNEFEGDITGTDLIAQDSDVAPEVSTIMGLAKNTDGTQTWGSSTSEVPVNAAIQVTFSMAMDRESLLSGISISPPVSGGRWSVSADWLTATFYPPQGTTLAPDTDYTITIEGGATNSAAVTNVYANPLEQTAQAFFRTRSAQNVDQSAPNTTFETPLDASGVLVDKNQWPISAPIRLRSDEVLDINHLVLAATPSLGAKPGVLYVGKDKDPTEDKPYVYEFQLGVPLEFGTAYSLSASGGTDLAGNTMNSPVHSIRTETADEANSSGLGGIDTTQDTATQNTQAQVQDLLAKFIRSLNERNLAQLQGNFAGNFAFQYDSTRGLSEEDTNKDGRWSAAEFSQLLSQVFPFWEDCGLTVAGRIPTAIRFGLDSTTGAVDSTHAEFRFDFTSTVTKTSQECLEEVPPEELYAVADNKNGVWLLSRLAEVSLLDGTGNLPALSTPSVLPLRGMFHGLVAGDTDVANSGTAVANGGTLPAAALPTSNPDGSGVTNPLTFAWQPVTDATGYIFVIFNNNEPWRGRAWALPASATALQLPNSSATGELPALPASAEGLHDRFGFETSFNGQKLGIGLQQPGEELTWEVMALNSNTPRSYRDGTAKPLAQDLKALSPLFRYRNEGTRSRMEVFVTANGVPQSFSQFVDGYDVGSAGTIDIRITSPNPGDPDPNAIGFCGSGPCLRLSGFGFEEYNLDFQPNGSVFEANVLGVPLFKGNNHVDIWDGSQQQRFFNVLTDGGRDPDIALSLLDPTGTAIDLDSFQYAEVSVPTVTINGTISDSTLGITEIRYDQWNEEQQAYSRGTASVTGGQFSLVDVPLYEFHNWFFIEGLVADPNGGSFPVTSLNFGLRTDTGSSWTPPIQVSIDDDGDTTANVVVMTDSYGGGSNWDASQDADNSVRVSFTIANRTVWGSTIPYEAMSDGGYESGDLPVQTDGTAVLNLDLYNQWNWVRVSDSPNNDGNEYWLGIYTNAGLVVERPELVSINGVVLDENGNPTAAGITRNQFGEYVVPAGTDCTVQIVGRTSPDSSAKVDWNGDFDGTGLNFYNEFYDLRTDAQGEFTVTVPVVGQAGRGYNNINVQNENYNWLGIQVRLEGAATCDYTVPQLIVDSISTAGSTFTLGYTLPDDQMNGTTGGTGGTGGGTGPFVSFQDAYGANVENVADTTAILAGQSTKAGRNLSVFVDSCGNFESVPVTASSTANAGGAYDWSVTVNLVDGYNNLSISDSSSFYNIGVQAQNGVQAPPPFEVVVTQPANLVPVFQDCGFVDFGQIDLQGGGLELTVTDPASANRQGEFYVNGTFGTFSFDAGGVGLISVPATEVMGGFNYVDVYNAEFRHFSVQFSNNSQTGTGPGPVQIIDPFAGATVGGSTPVNIALPNSGAFIPNVLYVEVGDESGTNLALFSTNPLDQNYGATLINCDFTAGGCSFTTDLTGMEYIFVDAVDVVTGEHHGHEIGINGFTGDFSFKPGQVGVDRKRAHLRAVKRSTRPTLPSMR